MADDKKEMNVSKATGIREPLPWILGAVLGPGLISSFSGGNSLLTLGIPALAAIKGTGATKAVGQGALTALGLSILAPSITTAAGGLTQGLGFNLGGVNNAVDQFGTAA